MIDRNFPFAFDAYRQALSPHSSRAATILPLFGLRTTGEKHPHSIQEREFYSILGTWFLGEKTAQPYAKIAGLAIRTQLVSPVVVIALVVVESVDIVVQHISIARRQPMVISRLFERINNVVQKTIVETALIEIGLHFG
jgi:hypothetical protein